MFRLLDRSLALLAGLATASLVIAIAYVAADIIIRKTFSKSLVGSVDVTELVVVVCAFLSIPIAFMRHSHVAVEIVTDPLPPRVCTALDGVGSLLGAALFAIIGVLSFNPMNLSSSAGDVSQDLAIPIVWYWAPMIGGCFLAALAALASAMRSFLFSLLGDT